MIASNCMKPVKFGDITWIAPTGHTSWTEIDLKTSNSCSYRMETSDFSGFIEEINKRRDDIEKKAGIAIPLDDLKSIFDVEMRVEKTPRQRYMHLKYP